MTPEERQEIRENFKDAVAPLGREIGEIKLGMQRVDDALRKKQIADAETVGTIKTEIADAKKDIDGLGRKVSLHVGDHWKWLLATTGIVGTIMAAAKFLG